MPVMVKIQGACRPPRYQSSVEQVRGLGTDGEERQYVYFEVKTMDPTTSKRAIGEKYTERQKKLITSLELQSLKYIVSKLTILKKYRYALVLLIKLI